MVLFKVLLFAVPLVWKLLRRRGGVAGIRADIDRARAAAAGAGSPGDMARAGLRAARGEHRGTPIPACPTCGQPASRSLAGPEEGWECRNEACAEFGQSVRADEHSAAMTSGRSRVS